jgi:hypothetical protein
LVVVSIFSTIWYLFGHDTKSPVFLGFNRFPLALSDQKKPGFASAVQDLNSSSRDLEPLRREVHLSDDELWRAALQDNSCDICATYFLFFPSLLVRFCCPVLSHGFWGTNRSGLRGVHSILRIKHCVWFLPRGTLW